MAINKNFVVKNGIEVNTNLIVADTDSSKVGIGTTVPEYTLHVFEGAGIGVTNITVTGISTNLDELNVGVGGTTLTAISNATLGIGGSVGVGTDAPGYLLEVHSPVSSGQTALFVRGDMRVTGDINIDDISIGDLNVSGISTFEGNILIGTGATVGFGSTAYFKDHAKAIFGDGEDLKVYHDGSNSYISDTGEGGLIVGSNSLTVKNAALNETQAVFTENGSVALYHDNGKRFETNAIGVEVSGTLQSTGITTLASSGGITTTGGDLYVGGDLYINEDIVLDTNLEILGIATIGSLHVNSGVTTLGGTVNGPNNNNSVVVGTGLSVHGSATGVAVTLAGAGGITTTGGDFYVGGDLYISEDVVLDTNLNILGIATIGSLNISGASGINTIDSTVQSTSKDTGSLVLQGGLGIEKQLYVGAGASVGAGLTVAGNLLPEADGTRDLGASGTEWKDLYIDGTANIDALIADTAKISDLSANRVVYSSSADGELSDSANLTFDDTTLAVDAIFDSNDTTQSTSATTGSAQFAGGVGIEKQLYVGAGASVGAGLTVKGDILPEADGTRDLGSSGAEFKDLYIDGTANIDSLSADTALIGDLTNNRVVIAGSGGELEDSANLTFDGSTLGVTGDFTLTDTDAGSAAGPELKLHRNSASPADSDYLGQIKFAGESDTGVERNYAKITGKIKDASNGTEDGIIEIAHIKAGSQNISARWNSETLQLLNETQISIAGTTTIGTGIGVTTILDEDSMASNSATALASQQSIKAYVDAQVTASDLDFKADSGGDLSVDLDSESLHILGTANEIETSGLSVGAGNTITIGLPNDVTIGQDLTVTRNVSIADSIFHTGDTDTALRFPAANTFTVETGGSEALRVDTSQRLLIGATSSRTTHGGGAAQFQIEGTGTDSAGMSIARTSNDAGSPTFAFAKTRNGSALSDGDDVGVIYWQGDDGTDSHTALCSIKGEVDGSVSGNTVPGRITFNTATTSTNLSERLRITSAGDVEFKGNLGLTSMSFDRSSNSLDFVDNAKAQFGDGDDLEIYHDGNHSYIKNGTGNLYIQHGAENMAQFTSDGNVELYYDNSKKLETTADGVDFSGTGSIKVPVGTTGERPTGVAGDFRYNSTTGNFEGYTDEWGAIAGGGGGASETDTSVSSTSATSIYTTAHATNRSVSAIIQITQGSSYQVGRYLVIHDGTTATIIEESAVATGDMLGSFTADINSTNLRILVNMNSASSATVTILPTVVTV